MNLKGCFLSNTNEWETPQELFDKLNDEFKFTLDPCSTQYNHKCDKYYTIEDDGLSKDWGGQRVFCNPPYGKEIYKWVEKCYHESTKENTLVCLLIPSRTDTRYFHDFISQRCEIRFIKGRLKFGGRNTGAPFPSMLAIFRGPKFNERAK